MAFEYKFGEESNLKYSDAPSYLEYLGTDKLTNEQVKQQFYKLACSYNISVSARTIFVNLSGLSENMPQALALLEDLLEHAKVDKGAWEQYVQLTEKSRADAKLNQQSNFSYLVQYGLYGPYNSYRNMLSSEQLRQQDPQELLDLLKNLKQYEHTLLYYGPMSEQELAAAVTKYHKTGKTFQPVPEGLHYTLEATPQNEVIIAPYDAKNIYMRMVHNEQRMWQPKEAAVKALFNEYFGGGMNTIVFQELREARGLAYNAYAAYVEPSWQDNPEYFFTHIITQNDKMMDCVRQFHSILDTIPESETAFAIAKEALTKRLATQRTTKFGLINAWLWAQQRGLDYDEDERIYKALPSITLKDIVDFEQKQMAHKAYRYIILGDEKELDMKALQQYGPVKRLTTEEIFGY
jgi:predicted Zn-dependent peptidase